MKEKGYRKITAILSRRIRNGQYEAGSALPPRLELLTEFGVARGTIDHCITALQQQGLVVSRHGSGTYVCETIQKKYRVGVITQQSLSKGLFPADWLVSHLRPEEYISRTEWKKLLDQDGLIWVQPEEKQLEAMHWCHERLPQVVVNRTIEDEYCVSTDHRGAYRAIAMERITQYPDAPVFILNLAQNTLPVEYRTAGVVDACRELQRFYEVLSMPEDFQGKLRVLHERLPAGGRWPLLLFSVSISNTGALVRYAVDQQLQWGKKLLYSDFDNVYPQHVWGIKVTSFRQDMTQLLCKATTLLQALLTGETPGEKLQLHFPTRIQGDT